PRSLPQRADRLPDPHLAAEVERDGLVDALGAEEGAVGGAEVLDEPGVAGGGDPGVPGGDVVVVEPDRGVAAPTDQQRRVVEGDRLPGVGTLADVDVRGGAAAAYALGAGLGRGEGGPALGAAGLLHPGAEHV